MNEFKLALQLNIQKTIRRLRAVGILALQDLLDTEKNLTPEGQ